MWHRTGPRVPFLVAIAVLGFLGCAGLAVSHQPLMAGGTQAAANVPMKVHVQPLAKSYRVGDQVTLNVTLRDAYGHIVAAPARTGVVVEWTTPDRRKDSRTVIFQPGDTLQSCHFLANVQGFYHIVARQAENHLRPGSYIIFVSKRTAHTAAHSGWLDARLGSGIRSAGKGSFALLRPVAMRLAAVKPVSERDGAQGQSANASPYLMFQFTEGGSEVLADGRDPAVFQVFYVSPDGSGAPRDIKVWLTWSNGDLEPKPLVIQKGANWGEGSLKSKWPVDARVRIVSSSPFYPVVGPDEYTVKFVPPIYGISPVGPGKLPLVDNATLVAKLYGPENKPICTTRKRTVTFTPISSKVYLASERKDIEPGGSNASVLVVPLELGKAQIEVSTPDYEPKIYTVDVTGLAVILLCLGGGVIGGLCAFKAFKGSLIWRIVLGIVGGALLTWLYVFGFLPMTNSHFAHSLLTALFVSIVGGYLGLKVLDFAARQFGFLSEQPKA